MKKILLLLLLFPLGISAQSEDTKTEKAKDSVIATSQKVLDKATSENGVMGTEQVEQDEITSPKCISGDCLNGTGTMQYPSGKYVGQWKGGLRHGQGKYTWNNGDTYQGAWVDDKRHGQGTYIWHDGSKYKGNYSHGIRSGYGIYYYTNGNIYEGTWQNNLKHGIANFYYKNSVNIGGKYFNNKYVSGTGINQETYKYKPE
ncbi:MAG TPA: hypothetical protein ENK46_10895 [Flavobacteriia bacterium]|jgi:hypothetical protein|nr:hypothetical protein [Flavobacteriia bacterium]